MSALPEEFVQRLKQIIPPESYEEVLETFRVPSSLAIRVNTLKTQKERVQFQLRKLGIRYRQVGWYHDALILEGISARDLTKTALVANGFIFIQSLSSMIVPLLLDPKPGESILDMCAAPGGKATQIAALMQNKGTVLALEAVRERYFKLWSVVRLLEATIVQPKLADARRFSRGLMLFDRILVDAPCSSEGRFKVLNHKTTQYWSFRKIKEMSKKQKALLQNACRFLKPGGFLVYSTCTFAPEENEAVIDWLLKKEERIRVVRPDNFPIHTYSPLSQWQKREFNKDVLKCLRILPTSEMEGFFIAKLMKT